MCYQTPLLKDGGALFFFSIFKMGYEYFFNYVKLSSALVPTIKNDCSLSICFELQERKAQVRYIAN